MATAASQCSYCVWSVAATIRIHSTAATMSAYTAATIACSPSCVNVGSAAMIVPGEGTVALNAKIALMPQCSNYELS